MSQKRQDEINIRARGFWEFKKIVNLCYDMGYSFSKKYNLLNLWFVWDAIGVSITNFESSNYEMKVLDTKELDTISFDEFLKIIHGQI